MSCRCVQGDAVTFLQNRVNSSGGLAPILLGWVSYAGSDSRLIICSIHMSAMKKSTSKPAKPSTSSAPATKRTKAKPKKPASTAAAVTPAAPKVKAVPGTPMLTTITARVDVGFGNALYVRGEGPGLSWDQGVLMTCINDDAWECVLGESAQSFTFKFLVNDLIWNVGADYVVAAGESVTVTPKF